ncbi:hypothetical protein ACG2K1_03190 [Neisseria sp. 23W00296]
MPRNKSAHFPKKPKPRAWQSHTPYPNGRGRLKTGKCSFQTASFNVSALA